MTDSSKIRDTKNILLFNAWLKLNIEIISEIIKL